MTVCAVSGHSSEGRNWPQASIRSSREALQGPGETIKLKENFWHTAGSDMPILEVRELSMAQMKLPKQVDSADKLIPLKEVCHIVGVGNR